jgi:hypothetical protein
MKETDDRSRRCFLKTGSILGLAAAFSPRAIAEAFTNLDSKTNQEEEFMTQTSATQPQTDKTAIRPFRWNFTDSELADFTQARERDQVA